MKRNEYLITAFDHNEDVIFIASVYDRDQARRLFDLVRIGSARVAGSAALVQAIETSGAKCNLIGQKASAAFRKLYGYESKEF